VKEMKHVILCTVRDDSDRARQELRLEHLAHVKAHEASIVAGGPALTEVNTPWMMILFTQFTDRAEAEAFIRKEPYTASGRVFASVDVRAWSQVLPEPEPGSLAREIDRERALRGRR